jgi:hypothetical protein
MIASWAHHQYALLKANPRIEVSSLVMVPVLPHHRLQLAPLRHVFSPPSSGAGEGGPPIDAAVATTERAQIETAARTEVYRQVQNFDWKTAANIIFNIPPKCKEFR